MATKVNVGLNWILLGNFSIGARIRRTGGSYSYWEVNPNEPTRWATTHRIPSGATFLDIPPGKLWIRAADGIGEIEYIEVTASTPSVGDRFSHYEIQLTADNIANGFVSLTPKPIGTVSVDIKNGIKQYQNSDFIVTSNGDLNWSSLAMQDLVEQGTTLYVFYQIGNQP